MSDGNNSLDETEPGRTPRGTSVLYFASMAAGVLSAVCFVVQGGFGGGHGDWDVVLWALSLPWTFISWPDFIQRSDFVRLTLLPFVLNVLSITLVRAALNRRSRLRRA